MLLVVLTLLEHLVSLAGISLNALTGGTYAWSMRDIRKLHEELKEHITRNVRNA